MSLIDKISNFITMFGVVTIFTLICVIGIMFYFVKIKKVASRVENLDTSNFHKKDSINYVPIKDIISKDGSLDGVGMIVIDDYNFVGGVEVRGFDYPAASHEEKIDAQVGSVQFFNVVEKPTSFRQTVRAADLSYNMEVHEKILKNLEAQLFELRAEYAETLEVAGQYQEEPDIYDTYAKKLDVLRREIFAKSHMEEEVVVLLEYMVKMSGDANNKGAVGQKASQIMFSYTYNPDEYTGKLTREEVYLKAYEQLDVTARSYIEALGACHFRAKRLSAREIIALMRKHTSPVTGENLNIDELLDSSYTTLFVSSDSLVEAYKEKIGMDEYQRRVDEYYAMLDQKLAEQAKEREEGAEYLHRKSYNRAVEELRAAGQGV